MSSKDRETSSANDQTHESTPEFSHRVPLGKVRDNLQIELSANEQERDKLCHRFGLLGLEQLDGRFSLSRDGSEYIMAEGYIQAKATQACVITKQPVDERIEEEFLLRFVPQSDMPDDDILDIETLLAEKADDVPHDGRAVDLGEALSEQLALCLTPYPRVKGSGLEKFVEVTPDEGEEMPSEEEKPNPFAALAALKEKKLKE